MGPNWSLRFGQITKTWNTSDPPRSSTEDKPSGPSTYPALTSPCITAEAKLWGRLIPCWRPDHGSRMGDNSNMTLLWLEILTIQAIKGLVAVSKEWNTLRDIFQAFRDGEKEDLVAKAVTKLRQESSHLVHAAKWSKTCSSDIRHTSQMTLSFTERLCPSIMTPEWPDMWADGRHWNWCPATIDGHRCPSM